MSITVVTTLHQDGYDLYGKEFVSTWVRHFPADWEIHYHAEKHSPQFHQRIKVLDFNESCPEWSNFYNHVKQLSDKLDPKKDKKEINRLKKALRWSFKMFALRHTLRQTTSQYVLWIDSDVYASNSPPDGWISNTLGGNAIAGQLENIKGTPHVETGVLLIDCYHKDKDKIVKWIEQGYINNRILFESKPWDGIWIGKLFESNTVSCRKIKMLFQDRGDDTNTTNLSSYWLVHKVGDHKFSEAYSGRSGRTNSSELI